MKAALPGESESDPWSVPFLLNASRVSLLGLPDSAAVGELLARPTVLLS